MGLDKQRAKESAQFFSGQKSGLPIESYGIKDAQQISNLILKDGALQKVNGSQPYTVDDATNPAPGFLDIAFGQSGFYSLHRFKKRIVAQVGTALLYQSDDRIMNYSSFNVVDSAVSPVKLLSVNWRDRIFLSNSLITKYIYATARATAGAGAYSYGDVGMDPPDKANFLGYLQNATMLVSDAEFAPGARKVPPQQDYYYLITLYDAKVNSESPGAGAIMGESGLYDLTPNSIFGPTPIYVAGYAGGTNGTTNTSIAIRFDTNIGGINYGLKYWLNYIVTQVPRATHFLVYRGQKVGANYNNGGINSNFAYNSFQRIPFYSLDGSTTIEGQYFIPIQQFLTNAKDFLDNSAAATPVDLATNNSPPPTPARATASFNEAMARGLIDPANPGFLTTATAGFSHMRIFRDQLFGVGAASPGYNVKEVKAGQGDDTRITGLVNNFQDLLHGSEVYQPDYFPYIWEIGVGDGQQTVGIGVLGDTALLVFKSGSTYYLSGSSPDNYTVRVMDTNKGCIGASTIQETSAGVICLSAAGFVLFNKVGEGQVISLAIQDVFSQMQLNLINTFYSTYDPKELRYYCAVVVPGSQIPNLTVCLDLKTMEWSTSSGLEGLARIIDFQADNSPIDLLGPPTGAQLQRLDNPLNVTFLGQPITATWTSGTLTFGDDQRKKKLDWIYLKGRGNTDWTVNIEVIPDFDESRKFVIQNFSVLGNQSTWYSSDLATDGNLTWENGVFASDGPVRRQAKIPISCVGFKFQIRIINSDSDPNRWGFALETISAEARMLGR